MLAFRRHRHARVPGLPVRSIRLFNSGNAWLETYMITVNRVFRDISEDEKFEKLATSRFIDRSSWKNFINAFRRRIIKEPVEAMGSEKALQHLTTELDNVIANKGNNDVVGKFKDYMVNSIILPKAEVELSDVVESQRTLSTATDLRVPHEWYPKARLMKRKIIFHGGPTNSGKTYQALQRLAEADPAKGGGMYCGPLRLLALEVYEKLNRQGVLTNLSTGQEKREVPGATHTSSTLEMVSMDREYDVVVIDEIQMISDSDRGYAWTRAVLGLRAREIHVCGGLEALQVVQSLVADTGDDFHLQSYNRLSTLEIEPESLKGDYSKIEPGDCIVAFSKADIFSIRREIENKTKHKCAVIYGQLPPETRSMQARLFNEENTGYDVLVASDAIGMGLNLNIRRTIFHTTVKFQKSTGTTYMDPSNIKQIAGRAGRLSSNYSVGKVTAWQEVDLAYVRAVMQYDVPAIKSAGIFPSVEQIEHFSMHFEKLRAVELQLAAARASEDSSEKEIVVPNADGTVPKQINNSVAGEAAPALQSATSLAALDEKKFRLSGVLEKFVQLSRLEGRYHLCEHQDMVAISNWLQTIPLSIADRFIFATAPVNLNDNVTMHSLYEFAAKYALSQPVALNIRLSREKPRDLEEFANLCLRHNILDLYVWLAHRFPKYFIEAENCAEQKNFAIKQIEDYLRDASTGAEYTHERSYVRTRAGLKAKIPDVASDDIRNKVIENLSKIRPEDMFIVPESATAPQPRNADNQSRYGRSGGRGAGRGSGAHQGAGARRSGPSQHRRDHATPRDGPTAAPTEVKRAMQTNIA